MKNPSFNPYFHGSISKTGKRGSPVSNLIGFNPYFHGSISKTNYGKGVDVAVKKFQSLFSWIYF